MVTLEHVVRYAGRSDWRDGHLGLVCSSQAQTRLPLFFQGSLKTPQQAGLQLLALMRVVGSRFYTPAAMLARILREADPVVTVARDCLRWEGFSACCSAYARVDWSAEALDGAWLAHGTTNVDLGSAARAALAQLDQRPCRLSVGANAVCMENSHVRVEEQRVELPLRWLRGLVEVQAILAGMTRVGRLGQVAARRWLQELPRGSSKGPLYVSVQGQQWRFSPVASAQGVRIAGWQRLRVLEDLLFQLRDLTLYSHSNGASAWQVGCAGGLFTLVLSSEVWRGFSGEGQLLQHLLHEAPLDWAERLPWEQVLSLESLTTLSGLGGTELQAALARLAARGQLGYDLALEGYFKRPLPYDFGQLEKLHPRLQAARQLTVRWQGEQAAVASGDVEYRVGWKGSEAFCNCPWYAQHRLERGPCKHILAAQWSLEESP